MKCPRCDNEAPALTICDAKPYDCHCGVTIGVRLEDNGDPVYSSLFWYEVQNYRVYMYDIEKATAILSHPIAVQDRLVIHGIHPNLTEQQIQVYLTFS